MITFINIVSPYGYEWTDGFTPYLLEKPHDVHSGIIRIPREAALPLEEGEPLHIRFARLNENPSQEAFLQFAQSYGPLIPSSAGWSYPYKKEQFTDIEKHSYDFWKSECHLLKLTRDIFLATKEKDVTIFKKKLTPLIKISEWNNKSMGEMTIDLGSPTQLQDAIRRVQNEQSRLEIELLTAQLGYNQRHLYSTHLPKTSSIYSVFHAFIGLIVKERMKAYPVTMVMQYLGNWGMELYPTSLLSYMWASLAEEVSGQTRYEQCRICGDWEKRSGLNKRNDWKEHPNCGARERMRKLRAKDNSRRD